MRHAGLPLRCRRVAGPESAKRAKSGLLLSYRLRPGPKRVQKRARKWTKRGAKTDPVLGTGIGGLEAVGI